MVSAFAVYNAIIAEKSLYIATYWRIVATSISVDIGSGNGLLYIMA